MRMNTRLDAPVHNRYRVACSSFKGYLGASFTCIKDDVPMEPGDKKGSDTMGMKYRVEQVPGQHQRAAGGEHRLQRGGCKEGQGGASYDL